MSSENPLSRLHPRIPRATHHGRQRKGKMCGHRREQSATKRIGDLKPDCRPGQGSLGGKAFIGDEAAAAVPHRFHLGRSVREHIIPAFRPRVKSVDRQFVSRMVGEPGRWRLVAQKRFADPAADLSKGKRGQLLTEVSTRLGAVASLHSGPVSLCSGSQTGCFSLGRNL